VNRYLLSILSLVGLLFWLVFSYWPAPFRPFVPGETAGWWFGPFFQLLALASLVVFCVIQVRLLLSTRRFRQLNQTDEADQSRRLNLAAELFWTALPLLMTLGLALLSYPTWRSLASP
jgi:heme/copper-type cytochrome/quinol oxidase subunit 2